MRSTGNPAWGVAVVLHGDAAALHLPDESVDLIVTSPPYFALRSYTDNGGQHYGGQIGSEATPASTSTT
jgi:DNA modification methylase